MTHTIEEFLARVEQHTGKPARPTWDGWQANCPAHDDRHASLSVCRGEAGHVLLKCHAGCKTDDVVAAIGWKLSDVTPEKRSLTYHKSPSRHATKGRSTAASRTPGMQQRPRRTARGRLARR